MKKIFLCLIFVPFIFVCSCASKNIETEKNVFREDTLFSNHIKTSSFGHSFLDESTEGSVVEITGYLAGAEESGFVITEKAGLRGAVTFILEKDENNTYGRLSEYCNQTITILGVVKDASRKWTKVLIFQKIVK